MLRAGAEHTARPIPGCSLLERIAADSARPGPDGQFRCRAVAPHMRSMANQLKRLLTDQQALSNFKALRSGFTTLVFVHFHYHLSSLLAL